MLLSLRKVLIASILADCLSRLCSQDEYRNVATSCKTKRTTRKPNLTARARAVYPPHLNRPAVLDGDGTAALMFDLQARGRRQDCWIMTWVAARRISKIERWGSCANDDRSLARWRGFWRSVLLGGLGLSPIQSMLSQI